QADLGRYELGRLGLAGLAGLALVAAGLAGLERRARIFHDRRGPGRRLFFRIRAAFGIGRLNAQAHLGTRGLAAGRREARDRDGDEATSSSEDRRTIGIGVLVVVVSGHVGAS